MERVNTEELLKSAACLPFGFLAVDAQGKIIGANERLAAMCGYQTTADLPVVLDELISHGTDTEKSSEYGSFLLRQKNGTLCPCECTLQKVDDPDQGTLRILYLKAVSDHSHHVYDTVTGLYERSELFSWIDHEEAWKHPDPLTDTRSTICLNLVGFRSLNESQSFRSGDRFLKQFGQLITEVFGTRLVTRNFADHFIIFYNGIDVSERLKKLRQKTLSLREGFMPPVEAGIYAWNRSEKMTADHSAEHAESALRSLKKDDTSLTCWYSDEIEKVEKQELYITEHFEEALQNGQIEIWLQPVIRSLTGEICSFEALSRWRDPKHGMIMPGKFVPVLEKKGLSWKLAQFVIAHVCSLLAGRKSCVPVSINFSREDFKYFDPFSEVEKAVKENGISRSRICIEITESTVISNPEIIHRAIRQFHEAGYKVWMDDFGSAYSSLNILKDYDFDEMKLDMAFLQNLNEKGKTIIRSCIDMAKHTGVHTLCEGVETEEQLEFLRDTGCEMIQGYFFSKPLPIADVNERISSGSFVLESEKDAVLYDSLSVQTFLQNISWCLVKGEDGGEYQVLYQSARFRQNITGRHVMRLSEDDLLHRNGEGIMKPVYEAAETVNRTGSYASTTYQKRHVTYEIQARLLAKESHSGLCMVVIRDTTLETSQTPDRRSLQAAHPMLSGNNPYFESFETADENPIATILVRLISGSTEDQDDFIYLAANEAYCRLMGRRKTDLIGRRYRRIFGRYVDHGWVRIASECIRKQKAIDGHTTSGFTFHMLSYMAVPAEREDCCSIAVSIKDDAEARPVSTQEHEEGILNTAVTRAIAVEDPDAALQELLRNAGTSLQADRACIFEYGENGEISNTYEWCREDVRSEMAQFQNVNGDIYEHVFGKTLRQGRNIVIHSMDEYALNDPREAEILRHHGIKRLVASPLRLENRMIGFIGIDNPPPDSIDRLAVTVTAFAAFTSALLRHRDNTEKLLAMNRQERITHDAIRRALLQKNPDAEIRELITRIGRSLDASRVSVFEFENDTSMNNTYEWCNDGARPEKDRLRHIDPAVYGGKLVSAMQERQHVIIRSVDAYAGEDPSTAHFLQSLDADSIIASPLFLEKKYLGFLVIDNPDINDMENTAILLDMAAGFCVGLIRSRDSFRRLRMESFYEAQFNKSAAAAVTIHDPDRALQSLLSETAEIVSASRGYIFEVKEGHPVCTYHWHHEKNDAIDHEASAFLAELYSRFFDEDLRQGKITLITGEQSLSGLPEEVRKAMNRYRIHRLVQVPVFVDGGFRGVVGFENPSDRSLQKPYSLYQLNASFTGALLRHRDNIERLNELSNQDALTGAGNRRSLKGFAETIDPESTLGLFYCDLNLLKQTNDRYGHEAGDRMILALSRVLQENCPKEGKNGVFRLGGDEFLLVRTGLSQEQFLACRASVRKGLSEQKISASVGALYRPDNHALFEKVMNEADDLMYAEKRLWHAEHDPK